MESFAGIRINRATRSATATEQGSSPTIRPSCQADWASGLLLEGFQRAIEETPVTLHVAAQQEEAGVGDVCVETVGRSAVEPSGVVLVGRVQPAESHGDLRPADQRGRVGRFQPLELIEVKGCRAGLSRGDGGVGLVHVPCEDPAPRRCPTAPPPGSSRSARSRR